MKELLSFIVNSILMSKDSLVTGEEINSEQIILTIEAPEQEYGKIIGKKGRIINAIRKLVNLRAYKEGKKVIIKLGGGNQNEKGLSLKVPETDPVTDSGIPDI